MEDRAVPDHCFDAALLVTVLGEIPDSQAALRDLGRVLKPSGRLVVVEIAIDPDFHGRGRLVARARTAGLCLERTTGGPLAYLARFRHTRTARVAALAGAGRREQARRAAEDELALALEREVAGHEARARLALAKLLERKEALQELERAAAAARRSPSRLVQAEVLGAFGAEQRRSNHRAEARETLREARELAHICGADGLEARIHDELVVAGARPQRIALAGVESLTASERRVAELAADGLRNREIAETLFVTLKTVEVHLGRTYAKLDIKSRSQLPAALGTA